MKKKLKKRITVALALTTHNTGLTKLRQTDDTCQSWPVEDYDGGLTANRLSQRHRKEHRVVNSSPPEQDYKDRFDCKT